MGCFLWAGNNAAYHCRYTIILIWKDEAFGLWISDWANIYDTKSKSYKLLNEVYETYYLVNIVDNNFVDGDMLKHILGS